MELSELKMRICETFVGSKEDLAMILNIVEDAQAIFPFNDYEHLICHLIEKKGLTFAQYLDIRTEYINKNPNLWIFEISAPRIFGDGFAQTYLKAKCSQLQKASKALDPDYANQYDMWLDGIRIEVKASRAVASDSQEPLYMKALSRQTNQSFLMNFQQLKPQYCDVFIWLAVFRDEIILWVMSAKEVREHTLFSQGQHRGNKGNEGQLHIKHNTMQRVRPISG